MNGQGLCKRTACRSRHASTERRPSELFGCMLASNLHVSHPLTFSGPLAGRGRPPAEPHQTPPHDPPHCHPRSLPPPLIRSQFPINLQTTMEDSTHLAGRSSIGASNGIVVCLGFRWGTASMEHLMGLSV
eukprot:352284-Chlamydomonas_euryale.AAC.1